MPDSGHSIEALPARTPAEARAPRLLEKWVDIDLAPFDAKLRVVAKLARSRYFARLAKSKFAVREKEHVALRSRSKADHFQRREFGDRKKPSFAVDCPTRAVRIDIQGGILQGGNFSSALAAKMKASPPDVEFADFKTGREP